MYILCVAFFLGVRRFDSAVPCSFLHKTTTTTTTSNKTKQTNTEKREFYEGNEENNFGEKFENRKVFSVSCHNGVMPEYGETIAWCRTKVPGGFFFGGCLSDNNGDSLGIFSRRLVRINTNTFNKMQVLRWFYFIKSN